MKTLYCVICNSGDGSNSLQWTTDYDVVEAWEALADDGDEYYASGDGLQLKTFKFPEDFDLDDFIKINHLWMTDMSSFAEE